MKRESVKGRKSKINSQDEPVSLGAAHFLSRIIFVSAIIFLFMILFLIIFRVLLVVAASGICVKAFLEKESSDPFCLAFCSL